MHTALVWTCLPFNSFGQNYLARQSEEAKKTRQTEEEVGRKPQGMDSRGVRQVKRAVESRDKWRKLVKLVLPQQPSRLRDSWWWWWIYTYFPVVSYSNIMLFLSLIFPVRFFFFFFFSVCSCYYFFLPANTRETWPCSLIGLPSFHYLDVYPTK